jgi:hypothetical protein
MGESAIAVAGLRKKAMLGCALIHNPSVLFLDEPLEGVDPISADVIRRLLTALPAPARPCCSPATSWSWSNRSATTCPSSTRA